LLVNSGLALTPDEKIVAFGDYYDGSRYSSFVARYLSNGSLDTSFKQHRL